MAGKTDTRVVLRVLVAGFALVVALLGLAGYVAVRGTRAIEIDAAQVGWASAIGDGTAAQ